MRKQQVKDQLKKGINATINMHKDKSFKAFLSEIEMEEAADQKMLFSGYDTFRMGQFYKLKKVYPVRHRTVTEKKLVEIKGHVTDKIKQLRLGGD